MAWPASPALSLLAAVHLTAPVTFFGLSAGWAVHCSAVLPMLHSRTGRAAAMVRRWTEPRPEDYDTEEEYLEELDYYQQAEADQIEAYREAYLDRKYSINC